MPTPTYISLTSFTLAATTSSVTISGIPQNYKDLVLVVSGTATGDTVGAPMRFNGDSGSNYFRVFMYATGSSTGAGTESSVSSLDMAFPRTTNGTFLYHIMDYSATDKHKLVINRADVYNYATWAGAGRWASNSAITSVYFAPSGASWATGTTFNLYGIAG